MTFRWLVPFLGVFLASAVSGQHAYLANLDRQTLTVVDLATLSVTVETPVGGLPWQIAVGDERVYASVPGTGSVAVLDTLAGTQQTFTVGGMPTGLALDAAGGRLAVTDPSADLVSVLDSADGTVLANAPVAGRPTAVAIDGARVYVATYSGSTLEVLDAASLMTLASAPVGRFPVDVAVDSGLGRAWVSSLFDDVVTVIDTATGTVVATIPVAATPASLTVSPTRGEVYVTHLGAAAGATSISVIDAAASTVSRTFGTGIANPADILVSADGSQLYVNHLGDSRLLTIDPATGAEIDRLTLGPSHGAIAGTTAGAPAPIVIPTLSSLGLAFLVLLIATIGLRRIGRSAALAPVLGLLVLAPPAEGQSLEIVDGDFMSWTEQIEPPGAPGMQSAQRVPAGGNPGAFRQMIHQSAVGVPLAVSHRYSGGDGSYDPTVRGAISAIDVSWDRRLQALDGPTAMLEAPAIFQDGEVFAAADLAFATFDVWESVDLAGLTAASFTGLVSGGNPNFSAMAPPLSFGYLRRTPDGFAEHHVDNFRVCVRSVDDGGAPCDGGGGGAGTLAFNGDLFFQFVGTPAAVEVTRTGGSEGAVSAMMVGTLGGGPACTVSWDDGETGIRSCIADVMVDHLAIDRLRLQSITGGATLGTPSAAVLYVAPDAPSFAFLLFLIALLAGWQPWALAFFAIIAAIAWRRRTAPQAGGTR